MTPDLTERIEAAEFSEGSLAYLSMLIGFGTRDPEFRDLLFTAVAVLIGADGADLLTLRRRVREIVDLAQVMQTRTETEDEQARARSQKPRDPSRPALRLVTTHIPNPRRTP